MMMRQTMRAAILMEVTVVDQMLTPNTVQNVFVINKHRMISNVAASSKNNLEHKMCVQSPVHIHIYICTVGT